MWALVIAAAAAIIVTLAGFYLSWRATRLDRLHARVETASAALDAALLQRCAVAVDLAASGLVDPATSVLLAEVEQEARRMSGSLDNARLMAEARFGQVLAAVCDQPEFKASLVRDAQSRVQGERLLSDLEAATGRLKVALRFYDDAVTLTLRARSRWLARVFRLAGNAPSPVPFTLVV